MKALSAFRLNPMASQLGKSELIAMISKIMAADGSEQALDPLLLDLAAKTTLPNVSDLIFYPDQVMSVEQIADIILAHQPLQPSS